MKPADQKIYLASKSMRRRELLRQIGVDFELMLLREQAPRGPDVDETPHAGEAAADYVMRVTRKKVEFAYDTMLMRRLPQHPVLAADTTVVVDGRILGKPANAQEAADMLTLLSGRTHQVMTSVAVRLRDDVWQATQTSDVTFAALAPDAIAAYCATSEPYDKAGGYAVQGMAAAFIEKIAGSYSSIMGLPLFETAQLLRQAGIKVL
jgi:septum formation protein